MSDAIWVCAVEKSSGRPVVHGVHNSEEEARQWGFENIRDGDFEVLHFPTINRYNARDRYKAILLERTKNLPLVFKRAKYQVKEASHNDRMD